MGVEPLYPTINSGDHTPKYPNPRHRRALPPNLPLLAGCSPCARRESPDFQQFALSARRHAVGGAQADGRKTPKRSPDFPTPCVALRSRSKRIASGDRRARLAARGHYVRGVYAAHGRCMRAAHSAGRLSPPTARDGLRSPVVARPRLSAT